MRARFGATVKLVPIATARRRRWWLPRPLSLAGPERQGSWAAPLGDLLDGLEARALWARFGL